MPLTPNNREEHWLQGMVDGQTSLEPNKRREYWYKEIVDAIGSGGGGGGGDVMIVTLTYDDDADDGTYTSSATATEISAANSEGKVIIGRSDAGSFFIYVVDTMGMITIRGMHLSHNSEDIIYRVFSMNTNTNKWTETTLLCTYHNQV